MKIETIAVEGCTNGHFLGFFEIELLGEIGKIVKHFR